MTIARLFSDWVLGIPGRLHRRALLVRLRLLQVMLDDARKTDNHEAARRIAPQEVKLRGQLGEL